jgi:hypothetical protein
MQRANGLTATSWSLRGRRRAVSYAPEVAQAIGRATVCSTCVAGDCRRCCVILDVAYARQLVWTCCTVTFGVYCEHGAEAMTRHPGVADNPPPST